MDKNKNSALSFVLMGIPTAVLFIGLNGASSVTSAIVLGIILLSWMFAMGFSMFMSDSTKGD
jgi:hypothetical protein